jgi:hypothetical protein
MENLFTTLASALFGRFASKPAALQTFRCCSAGSSLKLHRAPFVHQSYNALGDEYFTGQSLDGPATYGFVSCRLSQPLSDLIVAEQRLFLFMESLHEHYGIENTTGLDHGIEDDRYPESVGMSEYWQDADGLDWKVAAWTDGTLITVLYVRNISIVDFRRQDAFFDSFQMAPARKLA